MSSILAERRDISALENEAADALPFLYEGKADDFICAMKREIAEHPALHHPFLIMLSEGQFADTEAVLRDYAHQYSFYSEWFTRYLRGVIDNTDNIACRQTLSENMQDEQGESGSEKLEDRPHTEIFARFKELVGVSDDYQADNPPCTTVLLWRDLFLQKCQSPIKGVGISAIGLGTEYIIPDIYPYIINAIEKHTELGQEASLFFRLHVECDEEHAASVIRLAIAAAEDISAREAIRFGAISSLNLRKAFWDTQLTRAIRVAGGH